MAISVMQSNSKRLPYPLFMRTDPPVRIVGRDELQTHHHCLVSEDLVLSVTLSCPRGEVKWYKDGEKLQDTARVRLEQEGTRHALVILGAKRSDAGEYLCDSGDDSLIFNVTVEGKARARWGRGKERALLCNVLCEKCQF